MPLLIGLALMLTYVNLAARPAGVRWKPTRLPVDLSRLPDREVTFNGDVGPLLFSRCTSCHRTDESGRTPLASYEDAVRYGPQIVEVIRERFMPPWKPEPGYGDFAGSNHVTDDEVRLVAAWVKQGMPRGGGPAPEPPPPRPRDWALGEPDRVVSLSEAYEVPGSGRSHYRTFVIPLDLGEDVWVRALEYRPGNRRVVHHMMLYTDSSGGARKADAATPGPGFTNEGATGPGFEADGLIYAWGPGSDPLTLPEGVALHLPRGTDLALETHFQPTGKAETERSTVALYLSPKPGRTARFLEVDAQPLDIPAGAARHKVAFRWEAPVDMEILNIGPHGHHLLRDVRVSARRPSGAIEPLLWIRDWDFYLQRAYWYREPVKVPRGTVLEMEYTFDNSAANPRNPSNPPQRVRDGDATADEMATLYFQAVGASEEEMEALPGFWSVEPNSATRLDPVARSTTVNSATPGSAR